MGEVKRQFKYFTIMEYEDEQEYLRRMHNDGWKFKSVAFPGIYTFEACEPEDVVYQLDYNQEGIKNKAEYLQMFQDCGWEYLCDFVGYSYFRKSVSEMQGEEEIFNDNSSKLDMLYRVYQGRMMPLIVIFLLIICPQLLSLLGGNEIPLQKILLVIYIFMFILYIVIFVKAGLKYRELKKRNG